jgi:purine-binding chemotaxis protein CheW
MGASAISIDAPVAALSTDGRANEFLSFTLGGEEYGIEILKVQEIRGWEQPTRIASAPAFIKGVINLRGTIVPIVDLRLKFELGAADYDQFTVVIIVNACDRTVGIVVDSVSDVVALAPDQFRPAPQFRATVGIDFIMGLGSIDEKMLILVDIEKLIASPEMALFDGVR